MTRLLVLVLACGALLICTEAQEDYHSLSELHKEAIKLTVRNAHRNTHQHMNFYAVQGRPMIADDYFEIEIFLKATTCSKSAATDHRADCPFMTNRPLINCRVCSKRSGNDLMDPSVDCAPQKRVDKDKRKKMCRLITGMLSLMVVQDAEKAEIACQGCF